MYKNVSNQHIIALILLFSLCFFAKPTTAQSSSLNQSQVSTEINAGQKALDSGKVNPANINPAATQFWFIQYQDQRDKPTHGYLPDSHVLVYRLTFFFIFGK